MHHHWRVMIPWPTPKIRLRCVHGERRGRCIKDSRCPLKRETLTWKWMAEFRYKGDAQRYAKAFKGAHIAEDEVI